MDPSLLQVPSIHMEIYLEHWNTIKTSVEKGVLKDVYQFPIFRSNNITEFLNTIRAATPGYFKINVTFGFIMKNQITEQVLFCHPTDKYNTTLFETPKLIYDADDFKSLIENLEGQYNLESSTLQIPTWGWNIERFICVRFDVYKLQP